jgi:hypothetical protein
MKQLLIIYAPPKCRMVLLHAFISVPII